MNRTAMQALRNAFIECQEMDAPLNERLDAYSRAVRTHIPDYAAAVEELIGRLANHGAGEGAPKVGDLMPPFLLPDDKGRLVTLAAVLRTGPAAITFHRGHWCPWCRISMTTLAGVHSKIANQGGQVVAIVPERQKFAAQLKDQTKSPFPVLTDLDNGYALSLNLAIWIGPDLQRLLSSYGIQLPDYHGNASWILPIPATFVIARDGRVSSRFIDPNFRHSMAIDDLVAAIGAAD